MTVVTIDNKIRAAIVVRVRKLIVVVVAVVITRCHSERFQNPSVVRVNVVKWERRVSVRGEISTVLEEERCLLGVHHGHKLSALFS